MHRIEKYLFFNNDFFNSCIILIIKIINTSNTISITIVALIILNAVSKMIYEI